MKLQNYQQLNKNVIENFIESRKGVNAAEVRRLNFSWSNWGFGRENFAECAKRLARHNISFIELHGKVYSKDIGYNVKETKKILNDHGIRVSGVCGMVDIDSEFSNRSAFVRQNALDYLRRQVDFCAEMGGTYILMHPCACGRNKKYDDYELLRGAEMFRIVSEDFERSGVRCCIEPIRKDEVPFIHTFDQAMEFIEQIDSEGVKNIYGDLYHMLLEEKHIGTSLMKYSDKLAGLHMADTNRRALGTALLDLDIVIMALYAGGKNNDQKFFCTAEPLGGGSTPYDQMYGVNDPQVLNSLVGATVNYFKEREDELLNASDQELLKGYI
jgi:Xylose isomerase-like TIM barrel.